MHIQRLHHAQVTIPQGREDQARAFYCGVLGLQEIEKPEVLRPRGGFWLELGGAQVHVGVEDGIDRHGTKAHIAYQVDSLDELRARLKSANVTIKESIPIPGMSRLEIRDPFGNRVEFVELNE